MCDHLEMEEKKKLILARISCDIWIVSDRQDSNAI